MSNANFDSRIPQPPESQKPGASNRFFAWIRHSRISRGRDRWVGGVCDGLARRLGWNVALVRALVILSTFFFGAGAAFYGMAWFILPDETDGRILSEELIRGNWDWNCLGVFLFMAVAICLPGAGWVAFALAALALWLVLNRQTYMPSQQWNPYGQPNPYGMPQGRPMPSARGPMPQYSAQQQGVPPQTTPQQGVWSQGPQSQVHMPSMGQPAYRPAQSGPMQSGPAPASAGQTIPQARINMTPPPATFVTGNVPPTYTAQPMSAMEPQPRYGRRKSGGPVVVLLALGALLLSLALLMFFGTDETITSGNLQEFTMWGGVVCVALGLLIVVLGCKGRRAGGLHAIVWPMVYVAMLSSLGNMDNSYYAYRTESASSSYEYAYEQAPEHDVTAPDGALRRLPDETTDETTGKTASGGTSSPMNDAAQQTNRDGDSKSN